MNPLSLIYDFLFNKKIKLSHRTAAIITIIFTVLLIDNVMGFSFNYRVRNELENIKKAQEILSNPNADSVTKQYALTLRNKITERKSIADHLLSRKESNDLNTANNSNPAQIPNNKDSIKNDFIFFLSTTFCFIAMVIFTIWANIFKRESDMSLLQGIGAAIINTCLLLIVGFGLNFILKYLPILNGDVSNNYIFNVFLQLISLLAVIIVIKYFSMLNDQEKRNQEEVKKRFGKL